MGPRTRNSAVNVVQLFKHRVDTAQVDCSRCSRNDIGRLDPPTCDRPDCPMIDLFGLQSTENLEIEREFAGLWQEANRILKRKPYTRAQKLLISETISALTVALK